LSELRIVLVTQEEPFYLPPFLYRLACARGEEIVGMVILRPFDENLLDVGRRLYDFYGLRDFAVECLHFVWAKTLDFVNRAWPMSRPYSASDVARRCEIPIYRPRDINAPEFVQILREDVRPGLLVSVAASQILKQEVLAIPPLGCINVHSAPLPKYQGMMPSFWAMANGEAETAVTVHYMVEALDAGDIILQEPVPIYEHDTLTSLIVRSKEIGVQALLKAVSEIDSGTVNAYPMPMEEATYFSFPKREDGERFRLQGRCFR